MGTFQDNHQRKYCITFTGELNLIFSKPLMSNCSCVDNFGTIWCSLTRIFMAKFTTSVCSKTFPKMSNSIPFCDSSSLSVTTWFWHTSLFRTSCLKVGNVKILLINRCFGLMMSKCTTVREHWFLNFLPQVRPHQILLLSPPWPTLKLHSGPKCLCTMWPKHPWMYLNTSCKHS